jgi:hypothetical protein
MKQQPFTDDSTSSSSSSSSAGFLDAILFAGSVLLLGTKNKYRFLIRPPPHSSASSSSMSSSLSSLQEREQEEDWKQLPLRQLELFKSVLSNHFPLWIGSLWLVWKSQPTTTTTSSSPRNAASLMLDSLVLSLLLRSNISSSRSPYRPPSLFGNHNNKKKEEDGTTTEPLTINKQDDNKTQSIPKQPQSQPQIQPQIQPPSPPQPQPQQTILLPPPTVQRDSSGLLRHLVQQEQPEDNPLSASSSSVSSSSHGATAGAPNGGATNPTTSSEDRYLELLVHNVSHTDLVLSLNAPPIMRSSTSSAAADDEPQAHASDDNDIDDEDAYCLCRPRFSAFDSYCQRVLTCVEQMQPPPPQLSSSSSSQDGNSNKNNATTLLLQDALVFVPQYHRSENTERYDIIQPTLAVGAPGEETHLPIGFSLPTKTTTFTTSTTTPLFISEQELHDLRVRGRDAPRVAAAEQLQLNAIFFPLLATLLPRWHAAISRKYGLVAQSTSTPNHPSSQTTSNNNNTTRVKKVLLLVSGVGTPRNWTHSINGNSTQKCAAIMKLFIETMYPDITVVQIHSETNIFRYDENILFVQRELMPCIQSYRDAHAKGLPYPDQLQQSQQQLPTTTSTLRQPLFSTEWRKSFAVTLSFADGSPARNHAIQAALRSYKPTYFHFWQLKTFWHESKLVQVRTQYEE